MQDTSLRQALDRFDHDDSPAAVRGLLVALGQCAASGQTPAAVPSAAIAPLLGDTRSLAARLAAELPELAALNDRWHAARSQSEADAIAAAPLERRLEAFFALEGLESLAAAMPSATDAIEGVADELAGAILAYDEALRAQLDVLCTLADSDMLTAWRRSLPAGFALLPWWLDGTLEARASVLARRTDAIAARISTAIGSPPPPMPVMAAEAASAIARAGGFMLAAATPAAGGITTHSWRHPSRSIEGVLFVPSSFTESAVLRMVFHGSREEREERDLVGEVILLNGLPAVIQSEGQGAAERVEAAWQARAVAESIQKGVVVTDGRGGRWVPVHEG